MPRLKLRLDTGERAADSTEGPRAAVAAVLRDAPKGTEVLLIRRQEREGDPWSGHMGFPGGRRDATDVSLLDTAVRETREEVGIDLRGSAALLGRLDDVPAVARGERTGMVISAFVFELIGTPELVLSPDEVAEVIWAPIPELLSGARDATYTYVRKNESYPLPAFDVDGRIVWGLTYHMLSLILGHVRTDESHG
ncbi:MAG: CoA pyrophosphatase [Myxococcales bacterium]|nr:CoA pyrophosphatase [Myxococcales bacterium]